MSAIYVYAIIPACEPRQLDVIGLCPTDPRVHTISGAWLAAVVGAAPEVDLRALARDEAVRYLFAHQRVVEAVMRNSAALPVKFGTVVPDEATVLSLLARGEPVLAPPLAEFAQHVQTELIVSWLLEDTLRKIAAEDAVVELKAKVAAQPADADLRVDLGRTVKKSIDRRRDDCRSHILAALRPIAADVVENALMDDRMVANLALLLPEGASAAFDQRLAQLDQEYEGCLNFRCVGPLPPYSFATVEVTLPSFCAVDEARRTLSLGDTAERAEIKSAYRRLMQTVHPDLTPAPSVDAGEAAESDRRLPHIDELCRGAARCCRHVSRELVPLRPACGRGGHPRGGAAPGAGRRGKPSMTSVARASPTADATVMYVYGVARLPNGRRSAPLPLAGLVPDAPVHQITNGDLTAFVSPLPARRFGEDALRAALADVEWVRDRALAHDKVLAELRAGSDIVPFRFCTIYRDARQVANALARHRGELCEALDRVRHASEWTVKVFCDLPGLSRWVEAHASAIAPLRRALADAAPGARYFLQKKYDRVLDGEITARIAGCVECSRQRLAGCASETAEVGVQSPEVHGRTEEMVMNAACLVRERSLDRFEQAVAALRKEFTGFAYEVSGPWPPYHFVSARQEGLDAAAASPR